MSLQDVAGNAELARNVRAYRGKRPRREVTSDRHHKGHGMSRTIKGGKGAGYEFWSARPFNSGGGGKGRYAKRRTHRAERAQGKDQCRKDAYERIDG